MNPDAKTLWRAPRSALAFLLACLGMLGPFSIDTYLPAFAGIAASIGATPAQMQQTLSAYLFGFAVMNLFHGALSDSFGRRPVVLWGLLLFTLASAGCALAQNIGALVFWRAVQGMSAGAGIVVSRAVIRDMFPPADAQRVMSQVTIYFGVAPAVAPMVGGFLFVHADWHSIFWFLTAVGAAAVDRRTIELLPETLHVTQTPAVQRAQPAARLLAAGLEPAFLDAGAGQRHPVQRHVPLRAVGAGVPGRTPAPRAGAVLLVLLLTIGGIMAGCLPVRARWPGASSPSTRSAAASRSCCWCRCINVALNLLFEPHAWWALLPIAIFSFGWALMVPVVTLMVLDLVPERRGMASSVQACVGSLANGLVAGVIAPLVMHSTVALAVTSLGMMSIGVVAWIWVKPHVS